MSAPIAYALDAAALLGVGSPSPQPLPEPEPGYTILRVREGLSLRALRDGAIGQRLMRDQDWYDKYGWIREAPPAGTYRLRIPFPGSSRKTAGEQQAMLPAGESVAPVSLILAALLCIEVQGGPDPLGGDWTRCAEPTAGDCRVTLGWRDGRIDVDLYWDDYRYTRMWAASLRSSE